MKDVKKWFAALAAFFLMALVFAEPKSTGLTDSDVKNWAKNLNAIDRELSAAGVSSDGVTNASKKQKAQAEQILQKYGISAPNSIEKYAMINQCATIVMAESGAGMEGLDAQSMAMMKSMGIDPFAQLKANINSKDYKVVLANAKMVTNAMNGFEGEPEPEPAPMNVKNPNDERIAFLKAHHQPAIDKINNSEDVRAVKGMYDVLSKSRGDCGFIYKQEDAENASKYKKQNSFPYPLELGHGDDIASLTIDEYDSDPVSDVGGTIDFKKNSVSIDFCWTVASFDEKKTAIKNSLVKKNLKFTIKSAELYVAKYGATCKEYVITTKEGPIIHLWNNMSFDGNAYIAKINFNGKNKDVELNWYEDNGN